jgi:hypothetical protein
MSFRKVLLCIELPNIINNHVCGIAVATHKAHSKMAFEKEIT